MWRNNQKVERVCGRIFLVIFLLALLMVWVRILLRGQADRFLGIEYRNTEALPPLYTDAFLNHSFQNQLETALSDQMPQSETIRLKYISAKKQVFNELSWISTRPSSGYRMIGKDVYTFDGHDYIIPSYNKELMLTLDWYSETINKDVSYYSNLPIKNKYQYIVTTAPAINFDSPNNDYLEKILSLYPDFKQSYLHIADFDTYMRYYMKNDHHWNYVGQYRGYKDIINLMFGSKEPVMIPAEIITFKFNAVGSKSREAYPIVYDDPFKAYRFNYKEHDVYVGNTLTEYGKKSYYNSKEMREAEGELTYNEYYGFDEEIILYDYKQPKKDNLIIIGYSDTNAVNELIASHFNKTWVLDPRFTNRELLESIISENTIQNLLLIPNSSCLIPTLREKPGGYN